VLLVSRIPDFLDTLAVLRDFFPGNGDAGAASSLVPSGLSSKVGTSGYEE